VRYKRAEVPRQCFPILLKFKVGVNHNLGPIPHFDYCQVIAGLFIWGALSDERAGLRLLLGLLTAAILGSSSLRIPYNILLSQIRDSPNLEGRVLVFISPGTGLLSYTPRHWVPFSLPPWTHRATMDELCPTSTRGLTSMLDALYMRINFVPHKKHYPLLRRNL
jgi:hypothetical protein